MTRFHYRGAVQALTLTNASGAIVFDGVLVTDRTVRLPDHRRVRRMVEAGLLTLLPDAEPATVEPPAAPEAPALPPPPKTAKRTRSRGRAAATEE